MKHTGSCHCGQVKFEVEMDVQEVMACNCSICAKRAHLLAFTPRKNFRLLQGQDSLTDYQWGHKKIHFTFCKVCGVAPFGHAEMPDGPIASINARCLDNFDLSKIPVTNFDGKKL